MGFEDFEVFQCLRCLDKATRYTETARQKEEESCPKQQKGPQTLCLKSILPRLPLSVHTDSSHVGKWGGVAVLARDVILS